MLVGSSANCVLACVRCLVLNKYFFERGALDFNFNENTNMITEITTEVDSQLMSIYSQIGIDKPSNHEDIIQFVSEDVEASTNAEGFIQAKMLKLLLED